MENYSDEQLIALAVNKDKAALETLIKRYLQPVYGFSYKYVKNQADAEDITQEVFVKVWRNLKKFDSQRPFRPWLYKIARNTCLDMLKKKSPVLFSELNEAEGDSSFEENLIARAESPAEAAEAALTAARLKSAVAKLKPEYAEVVTLYHQRELNFREISQTLSQPLNTVKSRYRRALLRLKKILTDFN